MLSDEEEPPQMRLVRSVSGMYNEDSSSSSSEDDSKDDARRSVNRTYGSVNSSLFSRYTSEAEYEKPRLLERDTDFHQSSGALMLEQHGDRDTWAQIVALYGADWFHVLLTQPARVVITFLVMSYTAWLIFFAAVYYAIDRHTEGCALDTREGRDADFLAAFSFSMITATTTGYGFVEDGITDPNFYYDCDSLVAVVWLQTVVSLVLNAALVGIIFARLGRADKRSHQVIFSNRACIRCVHGNFYFAFQVYDLNRTNPVVEAHVRCYAILSENDGTYAAKFQTRYMRLQNPNDELGANLFLSIPCTVVHAIDNWSPLFPPDVEREHWEHYADNFVHNASNRYVFPGVVLRDSDGADGSRESVSCPICGDSFLTDEHLLRHIRYMQWEESDDDETIDETKSQKSVASMPISTSGTQHTHHHHHHHHRHGEVRVNHDFCNTPELESYARPDYSAGHKGVNVSQLLTRDRVTKHETPLDPEKQKVQATKSAEDLRKAIEDHLYDSALEIVVVMEAIEPASSCTFQARNSYTIHNIEFDRWFAPCVRVGKRGQAEVNLNHFHATRAVESYVEEPEPVQSML